MIYTPYTPKGYISNISNPAGMYSRIFKYSNANDKTVLTSKCKYFEADTETCPVDDGRSDQHTVAFSLAPKMSNQLYSICSTVYTDQNTTYTELLDTLHQFGCNNNNIYCYIHNLDYDGIFLLNWIVRDKKFEQTKIKLMNENAKRNENKFNIIYNNGLLEIRLTWKSKCLIFRNSYRLWEDSIETIAEELIRINNEDIRHNNPPSFPLVIPKSGDFDYDKIRKFGEKATEEEIRYMLNDANVGVCVLLMFEKFETLGVSASGMAYKICIKSFQQGILTPLVIKYLLRNRMDKILEDDELSRYIRCKVVGEKTYVWCKSYDTVTYDNLTEQSEEYITSFKNVYCKKNAGSIAITQVAALLESDKINFLGHISDAVQKAEISEFMVYRELIKNIVYKEYNRDFAGGELADKIYTFLHLKSEHSIANIDKIPKYKNHDKRLIKSIDQYYEMAFPPLTKLEDEHIRPAYRGGISNAVELYSNVEHHNVVSIDINSSYSNQMANYRLPYGKPVFFVNDGHGNFSNEEYGTMQYDDIISEWQLYIIKFQTGYRLKYPNVPMISCKSDYNVSKYRCYDTFGRQIMMDDYLYMTNSEYKIFSETHDIIGDAYIDEIWCFNSAENIFEKFVSRLFRIKNKYKGTAIYQPVKVMLNSIYGRFAMNRFKFVLSDTIVSLNERGILCFNNESNDENIDTSAIGVYLPTAVFTTSYARCQLISTANTINAAGGHACYFDTDSIHFSADNIRIEHNELIINDVYTGIEISDKLGAWKIEVCRDIGDDGTVTGVESGTYICSKRYIETDINGYKNIRCAGVPKSSQKDMEAEDLRFGEKIKFNTKIRTRNGIVIAKVERRLSLNTNVYKTENGTVCSDSRFDIGDTVEDMYGRTTTVQEVIYTADKKIRFELV